MALLIRPETPADYRAVGDVNARAFGNQAAEASIVALLRHHARYDPDLSLVAASGGQIVGHVLFTPHTIRLLGQDIAAVNLAPIAVHPRFQRQGIGKALIEEGHRVARSKGYTLSFLLGHPEYYPRFGYMAHSYGWSELTVTSHPQTGETLQTRPPTPEDLPALWKLWRHEEQEVDFTLDPGRGLLDWVSPNPAIRSAVYLRNDQVVGYIRTQDGDPPRPRIFLAADAKAASAMVASIWKEATVPLKLPLHPRSASVEHLGMPKAKAWAAAMACPLTQGPFDEYYAQITSGHRPPGRVIWPVAFELS